MNVQDNKKNYTKKSPIVRRFSWLFGLVLALILLVICIPTITVILFQMEKQRQERYRNEVKNTLITADLGISKQLDKSLMATYALAAVVAEWNGSVSNFDNIGSRLMENFKGISALELAPDGNITYIYPLEG